MRSSITCPLSHFVAWSRIAPRAYVDQPQCLPSLITAPVKHAKNPVVPPSRPTRRSDDKWVASLAPARIGLRTQTRLGRPGSTRQSSIARRRCRSREPFDFGGLVQQVSPGVSSPEHRAPAAGAAPSPTLLAIVRTRHRRAGGAFFLGGQKDFRKPTTTERCSQVRSCCWRPGLGTKPVCRWGRT